MKKIIFIIICLFVFTGCSEEKAYTTEYFDVFDTYSSFVCYASSEEEFKKAEEELHEELLRYNKLFDIYNNYDGIENAKTINDNAGFAPVSVDEELFDIISKGKAYYDETDGNINIAMGSVLKIWHKYRTEATENPEKAAVPSREELENANKYTDINNIVLNEENKSVYITDKNTSIDLGAIAKGYAADKCMEYLKGKGITCAMLNLGGNVMGINDENIKPQWKIGITKPENGSGEYIDKVNIKNQSAVSSGNYQRYYTFEGKNYHHIIDKNTLFPADYNKSVTIVSNSSFEGDVYSTYLFILPYSEGRKVADNKGIKAVWVTNEDKILRNFEEITE